jgi:hypothetical protein
VENEEGDRPVPLTPPALRAMMTYYLFRSYRIFWGAEAAGVKLLLCVQVFLNISTELKNQLPPLRIFLDESSPGAIYEQELSNNLLPVIGENV